MMRRARSFFEDLSFLSRGFTSRKETILARGASSGSIVAEAHTAVPLAAEGVFAGYGASRGQSGPRDVLSDITLSIAAGELVVVIGPNGAGKSTLLRVLSGTLRPRVGVARLFGSDLS